MTHVVAAAPERNADLGAPAAPPPSSGPAREPLPRADVAILGYVAALLVLWSPTLYLGLITPRLAVVWIGLGPGLVVLGGLAWRGDRAARWAAAFLGWALVSTLASAHTRLSFYGSYGTDVGWIYLAGYLSAYALGRRVSPRGRRLLPYLLLAGILVNAAFGILEAITEPAGDLATDDGRVLGLMANSLFLAGLLVGSLALAGFLAGRSVQRRWWGVAAVLPLTTAVNLTGSRIALVAGAGLAVVAAAMGGRASAAGRIDRRVVGAVALAVVLGFVGSIPMQSAGSSSSRISDVSSSAGYQNRLIMWRTGLEAVAEKPVLGWGPGRFREATTPRNTAAFVRAEGPDKVYYDAHNVFVEHLVTSGVVGLVLLLGFTYAAVRRARGPMAWFAAGVAVTWMLNPISACTGPLAMLALGAAHQAVPGGLGPAASGRARTAARSVGAVLAVLGLLAGGTLLWADTLLDRGVATGDLDQVQQAERLLPPDATVTGIVTEALALRAEDDRTPANDRAVVESARKAVELDPTRLVWRIKLGFVEMLYGTGTEDERLDRAEASFQKGLELSRYSVAAMSALRAVADQRDDDEAVAYWTKRLCEVNVCVELDPEPEP